MSVLEKKGGGVGGTGRGFRIAALSGRFRSVAFLSKQWGATEGFRVGEGA